MHRTFCYKRVRLRMTKWVNWDESQMIVLTFQRTRSLSSGEVFAGYLVTSPQNYLAIGKIATKNNVSLILFESTSRWWLTNPGGGGSPDFKWRGWSNGGKSQNPKKSLGLLTNPKSPVTKFNPRALKKAAKQVWLCFVRRTSRTAEALLCVFRLFWTPPKNPFLTQPTQKNIC